MKACYALVGWVHRDKATGRDITGLVKSLPDQEPVTLIREPTNQYDRNAIQVWARGEHIGYLSAKQIPKLAMAMDRRREFAHSQEHVRDIDKATLDAASSMPGKFCARNGERHPLIEVEE